VLPLDHDAAALHAGGNALREMPLLKGLER